MKRVVKRVPITIDTIVFVLEIYNDGEIVFSNTQRGLDENGFRNEEFSRLSSNISTAIRLFREIEKIVVEYVNEKRPPLIYYTTGFDDTRRSLYGRLAKKMSKVGYHYVIDVRNPDVLYCYRGA